MPCDGGGWTPSPPQHRMARLYSQTCAWVWQYWPTINCQDGVSEAEQTSDLFIESPTLPLGYLQSHLAIADQPFLVSYPWYHMMRVHQIYHTNDIYGNPNVSNLSSVKFLSHLNCSNLENTFLYSRWNLSSESLIYSTNFDGRSHK